MVAWQRWMGVARLLGCVAAALLMAWLAGQPPGAREESAPANVFSAARAMIDVREIAKTPHPSGSADAARVRAYLVKRMTDLGVTQVQVQSDEAFRHRASAAGQTVSGGRVRNVLGVLEADPGAPALLLMAHYDTVPGSPGAADDTAGVAAILEAVRALAHQPGRRARVVVLFTDGEEAGLLGAQAFFANHPLARRVGTVINLESRGSRGRTAMFETGPTDAALVARFAGVTPRATANSVMSFVYAQMPNSTDFTVPRQRGLSGLNFAFSGGQFDYHSPTAAPAALDTRSLQDMGDQLLATTQDVAQAPVLKRQTASVYSDVFGGAILIVPAWSGWVLWIVAAALAVAVFLAARGRGEATLPGGLQGLSGWMVIALAVALAERLAFRALGGGSGALLLENRDLLAQFPLYMTGAVALAIGVSLGAVALLLHGRSPWRWVFPAVMGLAGAACSLFGGFDPVGLGLGVVASLLLAVALRGGSLQIWSLWTGLALAGLLIGLAAQALAPPLAPLLLWPTVIASLVAAAGRRPGRLAGGIALLLALLGTAHLFHFADQIFSGVGFGAPETLALFAPLSVALLLPLLDSRSTGRPLQAIGVGGLALAVILLGWAGFNNPVSQRFPRMVPLTLITWPNGETQRAVALPRLDAAARTALGGHVTVRRQALPAILVDEAWVAATPPLPFAPPPRVTVQSASAGRPLVVDVEPRRGGELRLVLTPSAQAHDLRLNGRVVAARLVAGQPVRLRWLGGDPVRLSLQTDGRPVAISAAEATAVPPPALPNAPREPIAYWGGVARIVVAPTPVAR